MKLPPAIGRGGRLMPAELDDRTRSKIQQFENVDDEFRERWARFEEEHQEELEFLEEIRERRNSRLDDAIRSLRTNVGDLDHDIKGVSEGKFKASRKWSNFYVAKTFVAISERLGVYRDMIRENIIVYTVKINYPRAKMWIEGRGLEEHFSEAEEGVEKTTAVYGPKPVPSWGAEQ